MCTTFVASWLQTAARDELLRFFLYLGVDMESVSDEDLVGQVDWAVAQLPNAVGTAYVKYCASAALPVRRRVFDVQVFQSRADVAALNSSAAECGTVSAQVESDAGTSPRIRCDNRQTDYTISKTVCKLL